ncbi:hypothetical protein COJ07_29135 [Bacillus cereus]|nr:hypothetical protein COJ07_29135 [Bacillus cereus]
MRNTAKKIKHIFVLFSALLKVVNFLVTILEFYHHIGHVIKHCSYDQYILILLNKKEKGYLVYSLF